MPPSSREFWRCWKWLAHHWTCGCHRLRPTDLSGRYQAYWSLKVNANWRVIFCFVGHDVDDVNYVDYH